MFNAPPTSSRTDALARAASLAHRARDLRRMQVEVQKLTAHEVEVLARTAASFFDAIQLPEFTTKLLPHSERGLRRIRHRILHRTINTTATGTLIRALLLGSDGTLRLFSARSAVSRDLLLILEPGRALPAGVVREVVDWTPMLRVPQFRPFEILEKISRSLDAVEEQIADAEKRVSVQWAALASGDLSALMPDGDAAAVRGAAVGPVGARDDVTARADTGLSETAAAVRVAAADTARAAADLTESAGAPAPVSEVTDVCSAVGLFDMFQRVESVADAARRGDAASGPSGVATSLRAAGRDVDAMPALAPLPDPGADALDEWDDFEKDQRPAHALKPPDAGVAASVRSLFPVLPAPR